MQANLMHRFEVSSEQPLFIIIQASGEIPDYLGELIVDPQGSLPYGEPVITTSLPVLFQVRDSRLWRLYLEGQIVGFVEGYVAGLRHIADNCNIPIDLGLLPESEETETATPVSEGGEVEGEDDDEDEEGEGVKEVSKIPTTVNSPIATKKKPSTKEVPLSEQPMVAALAAVRICFNLQPKTGDFRGRMLMYSVESHGKIRDVGISHLVSESELGEVINRLYQEWEAKLSNAPLLTAPVEVQAPAASASTATAISDTPITPLVRSVPNSVLPKVASQPLVNKVQAKPKSSPSSAPAQLPLF